MHADVAIIAGDFNRQNVITPRNVIVCRSNNNQGGPLQSDLIMAAARGAVTLRAGPNCSTIVAQGDNVHNQHRLRQEFIELVQNGPAQVDPSIMRNPSDHLPLRMDLQVEGTGAFRGSQSNLGIVSWNVLSQGISNPRNANNYWNNNAAMDAQMEQVVECLNNILNMNVQVVCLQEFGGNYGWSRYFKPEVLSPELDNLPGSASVHGGRRSLPGGPGESISQLQALPNAWLLFRPVVGRVTLIKASILDNSGTMSKQDFDNLFHALEISEIDESATVCQLPVVLGGIPLHMRIMNVHDNYAHSRNPDVRARGITDDKISLMFMRDPRLGLGNKRTMKRRSKKKMKSKRRRRRKRKSKATRRRKR